MCGTTQGMKKEPDLYILTDMHSNQCLHGGGSVIAVLQLSSRRICDRALTAHLAHAVQMLLRPQNSKRWVLLRALHAQYRLNVDAAAMLDLSPNRISV